MTEGIDLRIDIEPRGKGRPRFNGHAYTDPKTRAYETRLASEARLYMRGRKPMEGPLRVTVGAFMPIPKSWSKVKQARALHWDEKPTGKPDCDNLLKTMDAFNGILWADDAQIVEAQIWKRYSSSPALVVKVARA